MHQKRIFLIINIVIMRSVNGHVEHVNFAAYTANAFYTNLAETDYG